MSEKISEEQLLADGDEEGEVSSERLTADQEEALLADDGPDDVVDIHVGEADRFRDEEEEQAEDGLRSEQITRSQASPPSRVTNPPVDGFSKQSDEANVKREDDDDDFPYNDVTEDEVMYLETREFRDEEYGIVKREEPEVSALEAESTSVTDIEVITDLEDDDDEIEVIAEKMAPIEPPQHRDKPETHATGVLLGKRIAMQNEERLEEIANSLSVVPPDLMRGDIKKARFAKALVKSQKDPSFFERPPPPKERRKLLINDIPVSWDAERLRFRVEAYGAVLAVDFSHERRSAAVIFEEEKAALECMDGLAERSFDNVPLRLELLTTSLHRESVT